MSDLSERDVNREAGGSYSHYEVRLYYCPAVPLKTCNQVVPGNGKIVSVPYRQPGMDEFATAIQIASKEAPHCPVHFEPMIPFLVGFKDYPPIEPPLWNN